MSLSARCHRCRFFTEPNDGHMFVDTEQPGSHWQIAHTLCLPRQECDHGDLVDTAWALYCPPMPLTIRDLRVIAEHIRDQAWWLDTDLDDFLAEASAGTGRWQR